MCGFDQRMDRSGFQFIARFEENYDVLLEDWLMPSLTQKRTHTFNVYFDCVEMILLIFGSKEVFSAIDNYFGTFL